MKKSENTEKKSKQEKMEEKTGAKDRRKLMIATGVVVIVLVAAVVAFFQLNPTVVIKGDNVSVIYTGMFENGTVFGTNQNGTPLFVTVGNPGIIPGFSAAVIGMRVNEKKTVIIPYDQAYGPYRSDLVHIVNRTGQLANTSFTAGQYYDIQDKGNGAVSTIRIINITRTKIAWDENNPLAGLNLTFTIQVTGINPK